MIKDPLVFIKHVRDSIADIEKFTKGITEEKFNRDSMRQSAVMRKIEIIGEAVKNLDPDFRKKYPDIPWTDIAGMRDQLIHNYFGVNLKRVWEVVTKEIPKLKKDIFPILKMEENKKKD